MFRELWSDIRYRIRALVRRSTADRELNAEIEEHLARETQALQRAGLSTADARRQARLAFGGLEDVKARTRDAWGTGLIESLIQDVRYGIRQLRRYPAFASSAILILALGIAAATVIVSIVYGVLVRNLPYDQPDRLVTLGSAPRASGLQKGYASGADYFDWRHAQQAFEDLGLTRPVGDYNLTGAGEPERLRGARATASVFTTLRAKALIGRTYTEAEQLDPGKAGSVVVLSYGLWHRRFGGDRSIVGRTIALNGSPVEVIGVMGPEFQYPAVEFELWTPLYISPQQLRLRLDFSYLCVARLKPGVTLEQARAQMAVIAAHLAREYPQTNKDVPVFVEPMLDDMTGAVRWTLVVLLAAVGALFLAGCANLANLMLARSAHRARELSVRASLGATRWRLARQFFAETIPLAASGALLGILTGHWLLQLLIPLLPASMPRVGEIGVHGPVLATSVLLSVAAAFFIALAPATQTRGAIERGPRSRGRARGVLIVTEIACTVLLSVTTGLLMKSFYELRATDPGFQPAHVLSLNLAVNRTRYGDDPGVARYLAQIMDRVRAVPGVEAVGLVNRLPMGGLMQTGSIRLEGVETRFDTDWRSVSEDYFEAMNVPVLAGRTFNEADSPDGLKVGLIDERLARSAFGDVSPIGKRFRIDYPGGSWVEIVGVVGHIRQEGLDRDPRPQVYWPYQQRTFDRTAMVVRTAVEPGSLVNAVRTAIHDIDPDQALYDVRPMTVVLERTLRAQWLNMVLMAIFASISMMVATAGLYGVVSYLTAQRGREFGIRLALGAKTTDVLMLVLKQGLSLALLGLALGLALAAALTRTLGTMLHGVTASDLTTYLAASGLLIIVVLVACFIPAWRASRLDPKVVLQQE